MKWKFVISAPLVLLAASLTIWSCSETVGEEVQTDQLGYRSCESDADCDPFGYCNEAKFCDLECRRDGDCALYYEDWENYVCRDYRCVDKNAEQEDGDEEPTDGDDPLDCEPNIVEGSECYYWTPEECESYGWVPFCSDRNCNADGWNLGCTPDGTCQNNCDIDFGEAEIGNIDDYKGVYATLFTTAVRNIDIPLVGSQDTVSIHYSLSKVWERNGKLAITHKLCYLGLHNFKGDEVYFFDDLAMMMTPEQYYKNVAMVHHEIADPPPMEAGASFETNRFWEIRGAKIQSIPCTIDENGQHVDCDENLPNRLDYEAGDDRLWDQDFDGKPALTTIMKGAINGEVYSDQRWSTKWYAEVLSKDRMWGLNNHTSETYNLDATHSMLMTEIKTVFHPDPDRSYYRMQRIAENATCEDVMELVEDEEEWIHFTPHMDPETPLDIPEE